MNRVAPASPVAALLLMAGCAAATRPAPPAVAVVVPQLPAAPALEPDNAPAAHVALPPPRALARPPKPAPVAIPAPAPAPLPVDPPNNAAAPLLPRPAPDATPAKPDTGDPVQSYARRAPRPPTSSWLDWLTGHGTASADAPPPKRPRLPVVTDF